MTSHAAVVARGMGKPCVAGCEGLSIDAARADGHDRRARAATSGDVITIDGGTGRVIVGPVPLVPPAIDENFGTILELGRRAPPAARAGQRRHARGRGQGARVRRRGHRPLPHRAHVHGAGSAAGRAGDDHGARRGGAARGARPAAADAAVRLRGDLRGDGRASRSRSACSTRRCTSSSRARGGDARTTMRAPDRSSCTRRTRCSGRAAAGSALQFPEIYEMQVRAIVRAAARGATSERARRRSSRSCIRSSASARSSRGCAS